MDLLQLLDQPHRQSQFALELDGRRIGTIWTEYTGDEHSVQRYDLVWVERLPVGPAPLRLQISSTFAEQGWLDEFHLRVSEPSGIPAELHGERFPSAFSFTFRRGSMEQAFKVPLTEGGWISGAFSPLARFQGLQVGQTWRVQVFNPLAAMTGLGNRFTSVLLKVTGRETIVVDGRLVSCLVVEAPNARIWVDRSGAVQAQEMALPVLGRLRIVREQKYDQEAWTAARRFRFPQTGGRSAP